MNKNALITTTIVVTLLLLQDASSARILGLFMGNGRSHYNQGHYLLKSLAESGHEVILISQYFDETRDNARYKEIVVQNERHSDTLFNAMKGSKHNPLHTIDRLYEEAKEIIPKVFENPEVQLLLNTTFDLVIVEQCFTDALKVFAWKFKAPLVVFHPQRADVWINSYVGNPNFPSFVPEYAARFNIDMSFLERFENLFLYFYETIFREYVCLDEHNEIVHKYFPDAPDLSDITYNTSLVLLNSDVSMNQPVPKVPNMIDIGGFHLIPPKPLPNDVLNFMSKSAKGVVLINLDILTSNYLPEATRNWIVQILAKWEYDFVWIWDEARIPDQPLNVLIQNKSLPQQDVLANSKVKLFIHLGDSQSIQEAINYGVPQLLLPVLDEQICNAVEAQYYGYARSLPFGKLTETDLVWALHEMLENPKYLEESRRRSKIFKAKPIPPKEAVVFWIDYVLKTNGAGHLRISSLNYSWWQVGMFDTLGTVFAVFIVTCYLLKLLILLIWRKCCCCCCCCKGKKQNNGNDYDSISSVPEIV